MPQAPGGAPQVPRIAHRPVLKVAQLGELGLKLNRILLLFFRNHTCIHIDWKMALKNKMIKNLLLSMRLRKFI